VSKAMASLILAFAIFVAAVLGSLVLEYLPCHERQSWLTVYEVAAVLAGVIAHRKISYRHGLPFLNESPCKNCGAMVHFRQAACPACGAGHTPAKRERVLSDLFALFTIPMVYLFIVIPFFVFTYSDYKCIAFCSVINSALANIAREQDEVMKKTGAYHTEPPDRPFPPDFDPGWRHIILAKVLVEKDRYVYIGASPGCLRKEDSFPIVKIWDSGSKEYFLDETFSPPLPPQDRFVAYTALGRVDWAKDQLNKYEALDVSKARFYGKSAMDLAIANGRQEMISFLGEYASAKKSAHLSH